MKGASLELVRRTAPATHVLLEPVFDRHGVTGELRKILCALVDSYELKIVLDWLIAYDPESALTSDVREVYYEERRSRLLPCSGGCGVTLPASQLQLHAGDIPGAFGSFCPACEERESTREQRRLSRRSIRSALARARSARLPATLTEGQWKEALAFFNDACAYCGGAWYVVEHVIPIELGGGTTRENCVPACFSCNVAKGSNTLETWKLNSQERLLAIRKWQDRE